MTMEPAKVRLPLPAVFTKPVAPGERTATGVGASAPAISVRELSVFFGSNQVLKRVNLDVPARAVTAIIGPSGCGKSTFLRAINRLHDLVPNSRVEGKIQLFGQDIYAPQLEPVQVRRRIGMVFQKSNP